MLISLRRRLLAILLGLTLMIWSISAVVTAIQAHRMLTQQVDSQLLHYVNMSQHILRSTLDDPQVMAYFKSQARLETSATQLARVASIGTSEQGQASNLWFGGTQILVGDDAPAFPKPVVEGITSWHPGASTDQPTWRILYRYDTEFDVWLAVGVDMKNALDVGLASFAQVLLPLIVILPVTAIIVLFGVGRGLRPLNQLAEQIATRKLQALESIAMDRVPVEIIPVVASLNELFARLHRALDSERRFTANAAHELQTPLAAIKAEVQLCQRQVSEPAARAMLDRISVRVSRATDTVQQLLTLARLDPDQEFAKQPVELRNLLLEVLAELGGMAMDRQLEIQLDEGPAIWVEGNAELLRTLLRNLLINAFNYALSPSEIEIELLQANGFSTLSIANDCSPIEEAQFLRLKDRFYRMPGSGRQGAGLGLSIVERIAELHDIQLHISRWREARGFKVELVFHSQPIALG